MAEWLNHEMIHLTALDRAIRPIRQVHQTAHNSQRAVKIHPSAGDKPHAF